MTRAVNPEGDRVAYSEAEMVSRRQKIAQEIQRGKSDAEIARQLGASRQPFFDLVDLIFDGDIVAAGFFLNSIASLVQKPGTKWAYMVLLIGAQGIGKSMLVEMVAELVGRQNTAFPTLDVFKGQFTGWMLKAYVIIFHELEKMGREGATRLKHWITATTLQINAKNVPEFNIQNYTNILACSNHDDVASLDRDDRRMFSWISHAEKQPQDFYSNLYAWFFEGDGLGIVLHHLLQRDLSGFNPKMAPPKTAGRDRLIANSQSEAENFLSDALESVSPPFVDIGLVGLIKYSKVIDFHGCSISIERDARHARQAHAGFTTRF